jgi:nucleotide-binding universal stress UspA family protein
LVTAALTPSDVAEAHAQEFQDAAVAGVLGDYDVLPVLSRRVVQGDAAEVLVRAASTADYLVVGTGRKGTLWRALLGSVSESCVRRARCPVVVVPEPAEAALLESAS